MVRSMTVAVLWSPIISLGKIKMEIDWNTELSRAEQALLQRLGVRLWHDWYSDRVCIHRRYWEAVNPTMREVITLVLDHHRNKERAHNAV